MDSLIRMRGAMALCFAILLSFAGCGGGSSQMSSAPAVATSPDPQTCSGSGCGSAMLTITDAQGDFTTFAVTVTGIQLKRANGSSVETLSKSAKIDFAQLVDLSEVLSIGQIPPGNYVGATVGLDFTGATLIVDDGSSMGLKVAPVDSNGNAITTLNLDVQLDNKNHLVITPGRIMRLALDFNLLASNTVDLTKATTTVRPVLVASVMPADTKRTRVRGALASVDSSGGSYVVNIRPFHESSGSGGQLTVHTTIQTTYEINGTAYQGAAGLTALAALPAGTITAAFGALQVSDMSFTASAVFAGTSHENLEMDHLLGDVVARNGNTLAVRGIEVSRHGGDVDFNRATFSVSIGSQTIVTKEGQPGTVDVAAISVGQRIEVFGQEVATTNSSGNGSNILLDATAGRVRLAITPLWGIVTNTVGATSSGPGTVTLNLQEIDGRAANAYDFAGTGKSAAENAKASSYIVDTQTLPLTGLAVNSPTRFFGFATPFGSAHPDFKAMTLVDYSDLRAELEVTWRLGGATAPFSTQNGTQLTIDLANPSLGLKHGIEFGPLDVDLKSLPSSPLIVPASASSMQLYSIAHATAHRVDNFNTFADFIAALNTALNGSTHAFAFTAHGTYDRATNTFTAEHIAIVVD